MNVEIKQILPTDHEVKELFKLLDTHNMTHVPPEECHLTQPDEMKKVESILLGIFNDEALCGMGGLRFFDDYAEVTRMFVLEEHRGKGLATRLLGELEIEAMRRNKSFLRLETSHRFEHAYRLYLKHGFHLCEPFGAYAHATHQHAYMEKKMREGIPE